MTIVEIDGAAITGIPSLYDELNRVLMTGADWTMGQSLDALNDVLYGGFGAYAPGEPVTLRWRDFEVSAAALGIEATRAWLRGKLESPGVFDDARIRADLAALDAGTGPTYIEIVLEIIAAHPNLALERA